VQGHQFASVAPVVGDRHLHRGNVAESRPVQHLRDERLELEGQEHMQESSNPTTTSTQANKLNDLCATQPR